MGKPVSTTFLPALQTLSLYVHIPFCQTKCSYCAFNTYVGLDHLLSPYIVALNDEIEFAAGLLPPTFAPAHTLYFGGGTPSLLSPSQVGGAIDRTRRCFNLAQNAEITLEINPGDGDLEYLMALKSGGVNRLSIGVQSSHGRDLALFRRRHSFSAAAATFDLARKAGFENVSIDLIYGAPYQTLEEWRATLDSVLRWEPDHVSLYSLSLEEGTMMTRRVREGALLAPGADLAADMYDGACERLDRAGFTHYEISNWARPGKECVHNRQYWLNEPFLGFGAGAHGFAGNCRTWNVRPIRSYIRHMAERLPVEFPLTPATEGFEQTGVQDEMSDALILGLRLLAQGVDRSAFEKRFGLSLAAAFGDVIRPLEEAGLLRWNGSALLLTPRAYLVSNQIFYRFVSGT